MGELKEQRCHSELLGWSWSDPLGGGRSAFLNCQGAVTLYLLSGALLAPITFGFRIVRMVLKNALTLGDQRGRLL
jgi:hypothetical protein